MIVREYGKFPHVYECRSARESSVRAYALIVFTPRHPHLLLRTSQPPPIYWSHMRRPSLFAEHTTLQTGHAIISFCIERMPPWIDDAAISSFGLVFTG